jgi:hypothetical protein
VGYEVRGGANNEEGNMEAASAAPLGVANSKRVALSGASVGTVVAGAVVAIVGMFLKGIKIPGGVQYPGSTSYISTTGAAKVLLASVVIGAIFALIAQRSQRKGLLWGTYVFGVIAIAIGAINAGSGFTLSLVNGGSVKADAAIGVFVALAGAVIMFVAAIVARRSARPAA